MPRVYMSVLESDKTATQAQSFLLPAYIPK